MTEITAIFFSCRRLDLLYRTIASFLKFNTYPISEYIIVNDSADEHIHDQLRKTYENVTLVLNSENVGLIKSIDLGYSHIKSNYFFHDIDDWAFIKSGFIEQSLMIMEADQMIEEVWLKDYNDHPLDPEVYHWKDIAYKLASENYQKGLNKINDFAWHGFTTACGLKRLSDYKKVGPYASIPWQGTIWHREQAIGETVSRFRLSDSLFIDDFVESILVMGDRNIKLELRNEMET